MDDATEGNRIDSSSRSMMDQLAAEFVRLGLDPRRCPAISFGPGALERTLARATELQPPVGWRAIFPEFPVAWDTDDPETWRAPYRPVGSYDYPEWPAGPLVLLNLDLNVGAQGLEALVRAARANGHRVYGYSLLDRTTADHLYQHADVVLERGTTEEQLSTFTGWIERQPGVEVAAIPRLGDEGPTVPALFHAP